MTDGVLAADRISEAACCRRRHERPGLDSTDATPPFCLGLCLGSSFLSGADAQVSGAPPPHARRSPRRRTPYALIR